MERTPQQYDYKDRPAEEVPSSVPASASIGDLDLSSLLNQTAAQSEQYQKTLTAAQVPIAQRTTPGLPSTMTRPIGPAPQTQGYAQPRSKGQAIANMITSAGNAVSKVVTAEKEQKQAQMVDVSTKFLQAQQLLSESQQQHDAATVAGNKEAADAAQVQVDKNKAAIQAIVSDPKHLKMLSEGLNINWINPSENKSEAHAAVQKAIQGVHGWNEKRKAAEAARRQVQQQQQAAAPDKFLAAYEKQQPTKNTPNQFAQAKIAQVQAQQKNELEWKKAMAPYYEANERHATAIINERSRINSMQAAQQERERFQKELHTIDFEKQKALIDKTTTAIEQRQLSAIKLVNKNPLLIEKAASSIAGMHTSQINTLTNQMNTAQGLAATTADPQAKAVYQAQYQSYKDSLELAIAKANNDTDYWNGVKTVAGMSDQSLEIPIPEDDDADPASRGTTDPTATANGADSSSYLTNGVVH